jgi:two-component system response regulator MprA
MRRIHTVLVIEDDAVLNEAMRAILEAEDYRAVGVRDGQEALERLRGDFAPCLILLDIGLPRKDGRAFRREQLADARLAKIPVVAYSGDERIAQVARELKVDHWFQKPVDFGALLEMVSRYCPQD